MHETANKPRIRLPERLAFTALRVAVAGSVAAGAAACSGGRTTALTADASADAPNDGGAGEACAAPVYFCGPAGPDASCPGNVCNLSQCPLDAGCEPFV